MPVETQHFGSPDQQWSLNLPVRNLDAMGAQLSDAGIRIEMHPQAYPNRRLTELHDPEGNPIQLGEPKGADSVEAD